MYPFLPYGELKKRIVFVGNSSLFITPGRPSDVNMNCTYTQIHAVITFVVKIISNNITSSSITTASDLRAPTKS